MMTEEERIRLSNAFEVFAEILCSKESVSQYFKKAFFSRGMDTLVKCHYKAIDIANQLKIDKIDPHSPTQKVVDAFQANPYTTQ